MSTETRPTATPAEDMADLEKAVDDAVKGVHDPDARRRARERMDRLREEFHRRNGEVSVAVDLIREVRDEP